MELVTRNFWWPGITKKVRQYVEGCDFCQQNKNQVAVPAGKLMPNKAPEKPWMHITADFITKLPLAQGYDAILVVCDWLTKIAHCHEPPNSPKSIFIFLFFFFSF